MGRGRIEIKKIENPTNRQVTYSKRRLGIMKKAKELTVLCDADVLVIMSSITGKFAEYCSPTTNTKRLMDRYQQVTGIDLWKDPYEKMQSTLRNLEEVNRSLRREIRQRMGEDLDGLSVKELRGLEQSLDETLMNVRRRKLPPRQARQPSTRGGITMGSRKSPSARGGHALLKSPPTQRGGKRLGVRHGSATSRVTHQQDGTQSPNHAHYTHPQLQGNTVRGGSGHHALSGTRGVPRQRGGHRVGSSHGRGSGDLRNLVSSHDQSSLSDTGVGISQQKSVGRHRVVTRSAKHGDSSKV